MIKMNDIIREGHETLSQVAKEVEFPLSNEDKQTMDDMMMYLINSQNAEIAEEFGLRPGVGLAAPQINVSKRMVAIRVEEEDGITEHALFNPKIISHSEQLVYLETGEGCLSVDRDVDKYVKRYARITVRAQDYDGNPLKIRVRGFLSIVFQHEIDHTNGILFLDRLTADIEDAKPL